MSRHVRPRGMAALCLVAASGLASNCAAVGPSYTRPEMSPPGEVC